jgi:hypothetical protein
MRTYLGFCEKARTCLIPLQLQRNGVPHIQEASLALEDCLMASILFSWTIWKFIQPLITRKIIYNTCMHTDKRYLDTSIFSQVTTADSKDGIDTNPQRFCKRIASQ